MRKIPTANNTGLRANNLLPTVNASGTGSRQGEVLSGSVSSQIPKAWFGTQPLRTLDLSAVVPVPAKPRLGYFNVAANRVAAHR